MLKVINRKILTAQAAAFVALLSGAEEAQANNFSSIAENIIESIERLPGLLTVSQEKLAGLDGAQLARLNSAGFLQLAVLAMASVGNISRLIDLKNRKRAAA